MVFDSNAFCWNGVVSTDADAARRFYAATIGWQAERHEFPNGDTSTMFVAGGVPRAHLRAPGHEKEPCAWTSYLRVDDVDLSTGEAAAAGGGVLMPPTEIPPGRMSIVTSPSGAVLCLFHERDEAEAENAPPGPGSRHWTELHSRDVEADLAWLVGVFGFEVEEMPIEGGDSYYMLNADDQPRAGLASAFKNEVAGLWLNWIEVEDVDAALDAATEHRGRRITEPSDWPGVGRMAMVADPTGAIFGVITPEGESD